MVIAQAVGRARINESVAKAEIKSIISDNPAIKVAVDSTVPGGNSDVATPSQRESSINAIYNANPCFKTAVRRSLAAIATP